MTAVLAAATSHATIYIVQYFIVSEVEHYTLAVQWKKFKSLEKFSYSAEFVQGCFLLSSARRKKIICKFLFSISYCALCGTLRSGAYSKWFLPSCRSHTRWLSLLPIPFAYIVHPTPSRYSVTNVSFNSITFYLNTQTIPTKFSVQLLRSCCEHSAPSIDFQTSELGISKIARSV